MAPVEREEQLAEFRELLADGMAGRGRIMLVSGGIGSGKTELLTRCTELAQQQGARVLSATGGWAEQSLDMALVEQLFHSTDLPAALADRARGSAYGEQAGGGHELTIQQADAKLIQETCAVLLALARERPLVVLIDDLQFADPASLQTLLYLHRRLRSVRMVLVFAEVLPARPGHAVLHDELNRQPGFRHIRLASLTKAGVGELLAARLGRTVAHRLTEPCYALSGGNPMLAHAIADDHGNARVGQDADLVVGSGYGLAVLRCLRRDDGRTLLLARAIAVLDELASPVRLARLLDTDHAEVTGLIAAMTTTGLLADGRLRHHAAVDAVLSTLDPDGLTALRGRAARLLHEEGIGAAAVARYLTGAVTAPEPWAIPVLRAAADEALSRHDGRHAVQCLELAGAGQLDARESAAVTAQLVTAQRLVDPAAAARHLRALHRAFESGLLSPTESDVLLRALVWQGRMDEAAKVFSALPDGPRPAIRDWLFYAAPQLLSDRPGGRAGVLESVATSEQPAVTAIDSAEQVLQSCRIGATPLEDVLTAVHALKHADRGDRASYWCAELRAEAAAAGATVWQAVLSDAAASVALRRGDLSEARQLAHAALDLMPRGGWGEGVLGSPLAHVLTATTRLGNLDEAAELVRDGPSPAVLRTALGVRFQLARGELRLVTGQLRAALGDFLAVGEQASTWAVDLPVLLPWRQAAAQVYVRLRRGSQATELIAAQLRLPGGARTRGVALRVLASVRTKQEKLPLLLEAVDLLRERGDWFELALAFTELSRTYRILGRSDQANMAARRAEQLASACEARIVHCGSSMDGAKPIESSEEPAMAEAASLSAAERRVANLAALGHTNREISRMLHVTVSTVEQHLTRTYRKLNISKRAELPMLGAVSGQVSTSELA
ncbi:regulatory LuxR family protein [Tamaricihabitans halophyticus]|uniref:Regulatory LuxR family protein n=1 Tax=Tamaricihabitans halophyticus TaxID=1262583 RepID=A0A4R2Q862_9PSEU|nr:LuxR family transcriptional regulator [Tamaricihabitans halophyticus]TCP45022.1 regulatory LuxR family protein [Tamaricihabitans halophyticus]